MYYVIGLILCASAAYKFTDLQEFVQEFQQYDIIAKRFPIYGYLFPILELLLGLAFLNNFMLLLTNVLAFVLLSLSLFGIVIGIRGTAKI